MFLSQPTTYSLYCVLSPLSVVGMFPSGCATMLRLPALTQPSRPWLAATLHLILLHSAVRSSGCVDIAVKNFSLENDSPTEAFGVLRAVASAVTDPTVKMKLVFDGGEWEVLGKRVAHLCSLPERGVTAKGRRFGEQERTEVLGMLHGSPSNETLRCVSELIFSTALLADVAPRESAVSSLARFAVSERS